MSTASRPTARPVAGLVRHIPRLAIGSVNLTDERPDAGEGSAPA